MISKIQTFGLLLPAVLLLIATGVIPLALVFFYSTHENFGSEFFFVGTQWYVQALLSPDFQYSVLRSFLFSCLALAVEIPLGLFVALRLPREGRFTSVLVVLMVLPLLTPNIVVAYLFKALSLPVTGPLTWMASLIGWDFNLNHVFSAWFLLILMDCWHWTSLVVLFAHAGLKAIPTEYYRAAAIDSASKWGVFCYVQWPRLKLMLGIAAILRFMDSFMIYAEPLVTTHGGPKDYTTFVARAFVQTKKTQFELGYGSAISMFCFAIVVIFALALFRFSTLQEQGS
jgi:glycerol transport system permease protein